MRLLGFNCGVLPSLGVWAQGDPVLTGIVTGVLDGDTIKVQLSTGPVAVRLAHIDAPESYQPSGGAVTRALDRRLLTQEVSLQVVSRNSEERLVAVVHLGDENAARSLRRGLWKDQDWIAPWDWRKARTDALFFATDHSNSSTASCMRELREVPALDD